MQTYVAAALLICLPGVAVAAGQKLVRPTALEVNSPADEDDPHVYVNQLFYSSNAGGKYGLMYATRRSPLDVWSKGKPVDGAATEVDDRGAYFVRQGDGFQYLFFSTRHDKEGKSFDIYAAQRFDARRPFSTLTPVQAVDTDADEMHPWLSGDGRQMYFSRKVGERWRIFIATRPQGTGPQFTGEPREIKEIPDDFHHATVSQDGKTMYLQGPVGGGRWGLFRSTLVSGKWSIPEELTMLNDPTGPTGDRSPALSREPQSSILFFASDRPGGKGGLDLYSVPVTSLKK